MNSSSDIGPASSERSGSPESHRPPPTDWLEALMALIAARLELIQLEAKSAARQKARRASFVAAAAGCAVFTWLLLLAGAISWISEATGWPWSRVSIGAAVLHGLAVFIFAKMAKSPAD